MKILFVTQMYPSRDLPQYAIFIQQQAKALIDFGHIVDVLVPIAEGRTSQDVIDGIDVYYVKYSEYSRSILYNISASSLYRAVMTTIDITQYDILHIHHCDIPVALCVSRIAKRYDKPYFIHYHGLNIFREYNLTKATDLNIKVALINKASSVICISEKVKQVILQAVPAAKTNVVYNGADTDLFSPGKQDALENIELVLTCVANLIPIKGQRYLIQAFAQLVKRYQEKKLRLNIVGRGPEEGVLRKMVVDWNLSENVNFLGYVTYYAVADIIRKSDIFILPSFYEGFGCVCAEAMAAQVATVACKGQGIDEVIIDGYNGLLAEPQDAASLEECIWKLLVDEAFRLQIAENGRRTITDSFTWRHSAEALAKVYMNVIGARKCANF